MLAIEARRQVSPGGSPERRGHASGCGGRNHARACARAEWPGRLRRSPPPSPVVRASDGVERERQPLLIHEVHRAPRPSRPCGTLCRLTRMILRVGRAHERSGRYLDAGAAGNAISTVTKRKPRAACALADLSDHQTPQPDGFRTMPSISLRLSRQRRRTSWCLPACGVGWPLYRVPSGLP